MTTDEIPAAPPEFFPNADIIADLRFMDNDERLQARTQGVGSSDIGIIRHDSIYSTPMQIWEEKVAGKPITHDDQSEAAFWGSTFEEHIAREFANRYGGTLYATPYILRSKSDPWMLASPDYGLWVPEFDCFDLIECKLRRHVWTEGPPEPIEDQADWQMIVTGIGRCHVVALFAGQQLSPWTRQHPDTERRAELVNPGREFWSHVLLEEPPPPRADDARRNRPDDGSVVTLNDQTLEMVTERAAINEAMKPYKNRIAEIDKHVKAELFDAEIGTDPDGNTLVTYKTNSGGTRRIAYK